MIELRITGETAPEFNAQLAVLAVLMSGAATTAATPVNDTTKTTTRRSSGKSGSTEAATSPSTASSAAGDGAAADPTGGAGAANSDASSAATGAEAVTRDAVAKKCTAYGSPQKGGPAALKELFVEFGSANGKWSEISDDKLPALNARLDDLLA